jgi:aminopeptidase
MDPRVEKLADVMVNYSLELKKGDWVRVQGTPSAMPFIKAFFKKAILAGANPFYMPVVDQLQEIWIKNASDEQLNFIPETLKYEAENLDALMAVFGFDNTKFMSNTDPKRQAIAQSARKPLFEKIIERTASGEMRWCGTGFPLLSAAQDAEMSLEEYEDFVYGAGALNLEDPVSHWKEVSRKQSDIAEFLESKKRFKIVARDTELEFDAAGRKWINCDGRQNFPDGEIFTGPHENSVNGKIRYSFPACYQGREVRDVSLTFKDGKVVDQTAQSNLPFLEEMLNMDDGARLVGEIAIGTNYQIRQFTRNTLFDEKIGGTCHLAVGASLPESGGVNKSALHWDMVCDLREGGEIWADGEVFYRDGKFLKDFS